jgi:tripartite-type tricarboxylate transporter receptor subunit TctC
MDYGRRALLHSVAGAVALATISRFSTAQNYPARPVRIVIGFAAGGPTDIYGRLIGSWLSRRLGQQFVVENRPGAGGNIAGENVAHAAPDGHTLLMVGPSSAINATLNDKLNFSFLRDLAPVAGVVHEPGVLVVPTASRTNTVPELIAFAKMNPGKLNMASAGVGTTPHMAGELFMLMAGVNLTHVPYRGGAPALADLLGGQVQLMFVALSASLEHIKSGRLRPLAVTTPVRATTLPDIPAVSEFLPGYHANGWQGIVAPRDTDRWIIEKLNKEINDGLADPAIAGRLADVGGVPMPLTPTEFGKLISDETAKWAHVIQAAHIRIE